MGLAPSVPDFFIGGKVSSVLVTATSVIEFIKEFGVSRDSFQASNNSVLGNVAKTLRDYANNSKIQEQKVLEKFQVEDISQLQAKLDKISSDFSAFQSAAIRSSMGEFREKYENALTATQLNDALINYISSSAEGQEIINSIEEEQTEKVSEVAVEKLTTMLQQSLQASRSSKKEVKKSYFSKYVKDFAQYIKDKKKAAAFSRQYKSDLKVLVVQKENGESISSWEIRGELEKKNSKKSPLNSYPYFNLTEEEKSEALKDMQTWNNFVKKLSSLVPNYSSYMEKAFGYFQIQDFFQYDMNGIVGILGEVQALAMLLVLLPNDAEAYFRAVGNDLINSTKPGVDLLLNDMYGFQIKNYQGYPASGQTKGYRLTRTLTAQELIERLTTPQKDDLGTYMAILSYNKVFRDTKFLKQHGWYDKEAIDNYSSYYNSLEAKRGSVWAATKAMIMSDINKFWAFDDIFEATMRGTDPGLQYTNVFWFFGGKKLVASSQIFNLLAARVEQLAKKLEGKDKAVLDNFYTTYHDNNSVVWHPEKSVDGELYGPETVSPKDILSNITVSLSLNLYLEDIERLGN